MVIHGLSRGRTIASRLLLMLVVFASALSLPLMSLPVVSAQSCVLAAEFATLKEQILAAEGDDVVGVCVEGPTVDGDGDRWQRTERGTFVAAQADGTIAFTDRFFTWRSRPGGVVRSINFDDFPTQLEAAMGLVPGIPYLLVVNSSEGTIEPVDGQDDVLRLRLRVPDGRALVLSEQPYQRAFQVSLYNLVELWDELGFAQMPPNAVINLVNGPEQADTLAVQLAAPTYDAGQGVITFEARPIVDAGGFDDELIDFISRADPMLPTTFGPANLYIASPPVLFRTTVILHNQTESAMGLVDDSLESGAWSLLPPARIPPGGKEVWESQSASAFSGTAGSVRYALESGGEVSIRWDNQPGRINQYEVSAPPGFAVVQSGGENNVTRAEFFVRRAD